MPGQPRRRTVTAKTADYTIAFPGDNGVIFTNQGAAGAVVFTLPAATDAMIGSWVEVLVCAAQNVTVSVTGGDQLIVDGDATADSNAWSTGSHQIGNSAKYTCVAAGVAGTTGGWFCELHPAFTTSTVAVQTIAT